MKVQFTGNIEYILLKFIFSALYLYLPNFNSKTLPLKSNCKVDFFIQGILTFRRPDAPFISESTKYIEENINFFYYQCYYYYLMECILDLFWIHFEFIYVQKLSLDCFSLLTGNAGFYEIGIMSTPLSKKYSVVGWNHPGFAGSTVIKMKLCMISGIIIEIFLGVTFSSPRWECDRFRYAVCFELFRVSTRKYHTVWLEHWGLFNSLGCKELPRYKRNSIIIYNKYLSHYFYPIDIENKLR